MFIINRNVAFATRLVAILLLVCMLAYHSVLSVCAAAGATNLIHNAYEVSEISDTTEALVTLNNTPVLFSEFVYEDLFNTDFSAQQMRRAITNSMSIEAAINSGEYTTEACDQMKAELGRLTDIAETYQADVDRYRTWEAEYLYATKVYQFLMKRGYSKEITCAIIGNMMVETGGNTLSLVPDLYDADTGTYFGLCQWSLYWRPEVKGLSFDEQLDYLMSDIEKEINTFGFLSNALAIHKRCF